MRAHGRTVRWLLAGTALVASCLQPSLSSAQAVVRRAAPFRNAPPEAKAPREAHAPAATPAAPRPSQETAAARQRQHDMGTADLFLAAPGTYAPRFDRAVPHRHGSSRPIDRRAPRGFALGLPPWSGTYVASAASPAAEPSDHHERREMPIGLVRLPLTLVTEHAPAAAAAPVPGKPKTFYVIPGCYAGDRRPEKSRLPVSCDLRKMRIVPPA